MNNRTLQVPVSLLLDPGLPASAKVVWMALRLHPEAGPAELESMTGLSRHTVLNGTRLVGPDQHRVGTARAKQPGATSGTPSATPSERPARTQDKPLGIRGNMSGARVGVPASLLSERAIGARAKLLFGILQTIPGFRNDSGQFTYTVLCDLTRFGRNTLKRAVAQLVGARWLSITQANRLSPIHFTLGSPEWKRGHDEAAIADRRLKRAKYGGEAIMQEYLSLLIPSDQFTDNARPGFLVNPLTQERLELDRFYLPNVAFEFHGDQHFGKTDQYTQAQSDAQRLRDLIKAGLCLYQGIHLVVVRTEDLSLQGMTKRIGNCIPVRDMAGHEPLIEALEDASLKYFANARRTGQTGNDCAVKSRTMLPRQRGARYQEPLAPVPQRNNAYTGRRRHSGRCLLCRGPNR